MNLWYCLYGLKQSRCVHGCPFSFVLPSTCPLVCDNFPLHLPSPSPHSLTLLLFSNFSLLFTPPSAPAYFPTSSHPSIKPLLRPWHNISNDGRPRTARIQINPPHVQSLPRRPQRRLLDRSHRSDMKGKGTKFDREAWDYMLGNCMVCISLIFPFSSLRPRCPFAPFPFSHSRRPTNFHRSPYCPPPSPRKRDSLTPHRRPPTAPPPCFPSNSSPPTPPHA